MRYYRVLEHDRKYGLTLFILYNADFFFFLFQRYSWTAVCRGAAIRGLEQSDGTTESAICSRIARASYGTMCNVIPWSEKEHSIQDREWCPIARVYMAADQASWFLRIVSQ